MAQDIAFSIIEPMYGNQFEVRLKTYGNGFVPKALITSLIDSSGAQWETQKEVNGEYVWTLKTGTVGKFKAYLAQRFSSPAAFRDWVLAEKLKHKEKKKESDKTKAADTTGISGRREYHINCGGLVLSAKNFNCDRCGQYVKATDSYFVYDSTAPKSLVSPPPAPYTAAKETPPPTSASGGPSAPISDADDWFNKAVDYYANPSGEVSSTELNPSGSVASDPDWGYYGGY